MASDDYIENRSLPPTFLISDIRALWRLALSAKSAGISEIKNAG